MESAIAGFGAVPEISFVEWAVVRSGDDACYNDLSRGIRETTEYLELFLRNLLLGESNELKNRYTHIRWKEEKQDIGSTKQDIQGQKQDIQEHKRHIEIPDAVSNKTRQHIQVIFERFGYDQFFGRTEVMTEISITASPASALIEKMLNLGVIYPMKGKGKGKYLFVKRSGEKDENN